MEAVLAVNTLAIASAVAWADWVMSCCGIGAGSEAMSQVQSDMVRMGKLKERGMVQNWLYLGNRWSYSLQNLTQCTWGCALPLGGVVFTAVSSQGTYGCMKCIGSVFLGWKNTKPRKDTTWSVPKCFLVFFLDVQCPAYCNPVVFFLFCERQSH